MFAFTSLGGKVDSLTNDRRGPYNFRIHGQNYHKLGSLVPPNGHMPKFSQLYIYDTENEISNRMAPFRYSPILHFFLRSFNIHFMFTYLFKIAH